MSRLGIRRRLLLVVVSTVAVAIAALVVGFNLLLGRTLSRNADHLVRSLVAAEIGEVHFTKSGLNVEYTPDLAAPETQVWVFSQGRLLEAPRTREDVTAAARRLAAGPGGFADVASADMRLHSVPVVRAGRRLGTVVGGVSLAPYEQTRRTALFASLGFALAVLLLVAAAARWLLASSLQPVVRMTRQASAWSEHDLDRRFGLGAPNDELSELAATLDRLLDRLAAGLRRERLFSAELSHELRTPLAGVITEAELALRRERTPGEYRQALEIVHGNAQQLSRIVDALVAAARHEAGAARGTADAFVVAAAVTEACAGLAAERDLEVEVPRPRHPIRVGLDAELAERILQPVVENACRYGRGAVRVSIDRSDGAVRYTVTDDGHGVAEDERERIFEPGVRGRLARENGASGAGLGLALARRLAHSADGEVEALAGDGGSFVVRLPAG